MTKWINGLSLVQKMLIRTFFGVFGMGLLVIVFYAGGIEMLLLTDTKSEWTFKHTIFTCAGIIFVTISLGLDRLPKVFDVVIQAAKKFFKINQK